MPAHFITVTCYGTWLHGDARSPWNRKSESLGQYIVQPDPALEATMRGRMKHNAQRLSAAMRKCVREAIEGYCAFKGWELSALNVRSNHFHAVVVAEESGSKVQNAIKARATRLLREQGLSPADQPIWTERGSHVVLTTETSFNAAVHYVLHEQGPDLPEAQ